MIIPLAYTADGDMPAAANTSGDNNVSVSPGPLQNITSEKTPVLAWTKTFGGAGNDTGSAVNLTSDGGFIVAGNTYSSGNGDCDVYLVRTDANGNKQWERTFGGKQADEGFSVLQSADGNYIVAGYTRSSGAGNADVYLLKVDRNGDLIWQHTYGGTGDDYGNGLCLTPDGGFMIAGYTGSSGIGSSDAYLIRTDPDGAMLWQKTFGGPDDDQVFGISGTADGGYVMAGWTQSFSNSQDFYVVRTDADGNMLWQQKSPRWDHETVGYSSWAYTVLQTANGQYVVNGWQLYPDGNRSARLLRLDPDGKMGKVVTIDPVRQTTSTTWNDTSYPLGYKETFARSMILADDGAFVSTGPTINRTDMNREIYAMKTQIGKIIWVARVSISSNDSSRSIFQTPDGGYILTGWTHAGNGGSDMLLMKLAGKAAEAPAPGGRDLAGKAAVAVAAVTVGTAMGFLGFYFGRIVDGIGALLNKAAILLKTYLGNILPVDNLLDFVNGLARTYGKSIFLKRLGQIRLAEARESVSLLKGFSSREMAIVIVASLLFGIAYLVSKKMSLLSPENLVLYCFMGGFVIILHDLTHRYYAYKYKAVVEYRFWGLGTVIMFVTAFLFGLVYAVPARTLIKDVKKLGAREQAIIFLAGPLMSAGLAIVFIVLVPLGGLIATIGLLGVSMNLLSAVYSLMPVDPLDGRKVYSWKKPVWAVAFVPLLALYVLAAIFLL